MASGALSAVLAAVLVVYVASECSDDDFTIIGGGSTAIKKWVTDSVANATQDANLKGITLPFYTVGSGDGQKGFVNNTYDYTISDYPLSSSLYKTATANRQIVQLPIAIGGVSILYNLPAVNASKWTLNLTADVAAQIFSGTIKTWDDPQVLAINQNMSTMSPPVPAGQPITVVVRQDSSAATQAFSQWLTSAAPGNWTAGMNTTLKWPSTFKQVQKATGVTYGIGNATWSIGFLDAYAGKSAYLPSAGLENRARRTQFPNLRFAKYNASADPLAAIGASIITVPQPTADWGNYSLVDLDGNLTYPLLTTAMVASAKDLSGKGNRGNAQKQVFGYLLGPAVQAAAAKYQEIALPPLLKSPALAAVNAIVTSGGKHFYLPSNLPSPSQGYNASFTF